MKMLPKLPCHFILVSSFVLLFFTLNASVSTNSIEIPYSSEVVALSDMYSVPPINLQIAAVVAFEYSGGVNIRCFGQNNGSATVHVVGGTGPYTYQWSGLPGQTDATAYGMSAGTYTVTVTDVLGFSVSESVTLTQNPPLQAVVNASPILCNGGVSTISISAVGGTIPYSGLNWYQFTAGTYNFIVADANGCRSKSFTTISEPPVFEATSFATPILCNGDLSNVSVQGFGGIPPYNGTGSYSELAGMSNYVITDANGCYAYTSVAINEPAALVADIDATPILCRGGESEITVSASGGVTPYVGPGVFNNIAGNYSFTVIDGNGCQSSSSIALTQPLALVATISNSPITCHGDLSEVIVSAIDGTPPYIGPGSFFEPAGLHSYDVTDANGCNVEIVTVVTEPTEISLDITIGSIDVDFGVANVEVLATGGMPPYTGTGMYSLGSGTYFFDVTDANGCSVSQSATVGGSLAPSYLTAGNNENPIGLTKSVAINGDNQSFVRASFNTDSEEVEITYELKYDSKVRIEILDMTGAIVDVIQDDIAFEGVNHTVSIETGTLKAGVYIYQFITDSERQIDKLQVIR